MKRKFHNLLLAVGLLSCFSSVYAGSGNLFNVVASGAPASLSVTICLNAVAQLSCQTYTVSASSLSITTAINRTYPQAGIKINTPGYSPSGCTQLSNGYCTFVGSNSTPTVITANNSSSLGTPRFAYIGNWYSDQITLCSIGSDGELSGCSGIDGGSPGTFNGAYSVALNRTNTYAYVGSYGDNNVRKCSLDAATGLLSSCSVSNGGYSFSSPYVVTLNPAGTRAYVGQYDSSIPMQICDIAAGTGELSACHDTSYTTFDYPTNVVFNAAGTLAYVGNYDISYIYLCQVNATNGDLFSCITTPSSTSQSYPTQITLNAAGTSLYAVWQTASDHFTKCGINAGNGELTSCTPTATGYAVNDTYGFTLNAANTYAYISDYGNETLSKCIVNSTTGELSGCALTGLGFSPDSPGFISILYS